MTTRGIRRKKSYLVDAKIAVCGQKAVGKSGKCVATEEEKKCREDERQIEREEPRCAPHKQRHEEKSFRVKFMCLTLNHLILCPCPK